MNPAHSDSSSLGGEDQPECPYILKAVRIKNDNMKSLKFGGTIEGEVTFEILWRTDFAGVWLQLEGTAVSRYKEGDAWQWKEKKARFVTLVATILGTSFPSKKPIWPPPTHRLEAGEHTFPIKIEVTERVLPASFDKEFSAIQYRMVVYWEAFQNKDFWRYSSSLEQFQFKGYLNVHEEKSLNEPLTITRKDGSFFSKKKQFKMKLTLDRRGYIAGEKVSGVFNIDNPTGETVLDICIKFVQKLKHADSCLMKLTTAVLKEDKKVINKKDKEIKCEFTLTLPNRLMPTFRRVRHVVEIFYILQFHIRRAGVAEMKGETEVVVGTDQTGLIPVTSPLLPSTPNHDLPPPLRGLPFKNAAALPAAVAGSFHSLPPSYANLVSSKAAKNPPSYSTVVIKLDDDARKAAKK